jgi:hypothetical protein
VIADEINTVVSSAESAFGGELTGRFGLPIAHLP